MREKKPLHLIIQIQFKFRELYIKLCLCVCGLEIKYQEKSFLDNYVYFLFLFFGNVYDSETRF